MSDTYYDDDEQSGLNIEFGHGASGGVSTSGETPPPHHHLLRPPPIPLLLQGYMAPPLLDRGK